MKKTIIAIHAIFLALLLGTALLPTAKADQISYVGTLTSSTDVFETTFTLAATSDVLLQTFGFGGGTNQKGSVISGGGTDPFLAIYAGTGATASILNDSTNNPFATSLDINNYDPGFVGCPSAAAPAIGGSAVCGDVRMALTSLAAGTYTLLLSDGQFIPGALFDDGFLGDSDNFADFTGGVFCNLEINGIDCPNTTGAYALDLSTKPPSGGTNVPEPGMLALLGAGMLAAALASRKAR
jgi:hypothetical protein